MFTIEMSESSEELQILRRYANLDKPLITLETKRLFIRFLQASDKDYYMALRIENSGIKQAYKTMPDFEEIEWENEFHSEDDLSFCIFLKTDGSFAGSCSYQNYKTDTIEIGIDVAKEFRNQGIGTEAVEALVKRAKELFSGKSVIMRTDVDNASCRWVAEKCGATLTKYEPSMAARAIAKLLELNDLSPESRVKNEAFIKENMERICVYTFGEVK